MHWTLFVAVPVILAIALGTFPQLRLRIWFLVIAVVAFVEILITGNPGPNWNDRHALAFWFLGIVGPWLISAIFLFLARYPRRHLLIAFGFAPVYLISALVCLVVGDGLGLIPQ